MRTRICIAGIPRGGKTTLAAHLAHALKVTPRSTDELIGKHDWSAASEAASHWFDDGGSWVIEGVAVPRALRKWLDRNLVGKPCDQVVWMDSAFVPLSQGQATMAKGCKTVWNQMLPLLMQRGVALVKYPVMHPEDSAG